MRHKAIFFTTNTADVFFLIFQALVSMGYDVTTKNNFGAAASLLPYNHHYQSGGTRLSTHCPESNGMEATELSREDVSSPRGNQKATINGNVSYNTFSPYDTNPLPGHEYRQHSNMSQHYEELKVSIEHERERIPVERSNNETFNFVSKDDDDKDHDAIPNEKDNDNTNNVCGVINDDDEIIYARPEKLKKNYNCVNNSTDKSTIHHLESSKGDEYSNLQDIDVRRNMQCSPAAVLIQDNGGLEGRRHRIGAASMLVDKEPQKDIYEINEEVVERDQVPIQCQDIICKDQITSKDQCAIKEDNVPLSIVLRQWLALMSKSAARLDR